MNDEQPRRRVRPYALISAPLSIISLIVAFFYGGGTFFVTLGVMLLGLALFGFFLDR